ncbi:D-alanyl-D-alanine carboxypeptidase [Synechococcus sp. PCC 7335]|uniref:D-alanyl-D-alanine carboxypeptidase n=1 Tax=Synechococcus sp. (strain ATCC 29403 / PCC 7335) TaxID=91464 RepID=UPI001D0D1749|nr:D-alanyl-D-alanine carboxypeptidase [Synechococcus sp. PCC 7335]
MSPMIVLAVLAGLLSGLLGGQKLARPLNLSAVDIRPRWESTWAKSAIANDPAAKSIVANYLSGLTAAGYWPREQGIWVSVGDYPVAENLGTVPMPAASLTKIATTLAALATWEPTHQFETWVGWRGDVENGVLFGDLVVVGDDDPLFVWEEAIALGKALQQQGIRQVKGDLIIVGPFHMNFETDPGTSGALLKQALNADEWDYEVETAYQKLAAVAKKSAIEALKPTIAISGGIEVAPIHQKESVDGWFLRHDSLPMVAVLKAMNIYSNNPMAEQMANAVGGSSAVVRKVEAIAGIPPGEVKLINGSGLGEENRISPRAAVLMLQSIQLQLVDSGFTLSDIFPIAGADGGTVLDRQLPTNAVVKTGSLAVVSSLAGAFPTETKGVVWFSIMNYGSGLDTLRSRQDQVLSALEQQWGKAQTLPPELRSSIVIGQAPYQFGDHSRNHPVDRESVSHSLL